MKRVVLFILIVSLAFTGCAHFNRQETTETIVPPLQSSPQETVSPAMENEVVSTDPKTPTIDSSPVYTQLPMSAISLPLSTQYHQVDGTVIYRYTYQNIYLTVQDQPVADTIIINYLNRLDYSHRISQDLAEEATAAYTGGENWIPYYFESIYTPTRIDKSVLSLFGRNVIYTGGNHSQQECIAANYNMITGEVLTLGSILRNADSTTKLSDLAISKLRTQENTLNLFNEYPEVIRERFSRDVSFDEDWFLTNTGLVFYFAPYEIAPYATGVVTVEIPYAELVGIISDEFFPEETDASTGVLHAAHLMDTDIDGFTQIAELQLNENGEQVFLSCEGILRNVQVITGSWNEDGTVFNEYAIVFACQTLSPGDGILIITDIPDVMPTLKITYMAASTYNEQFISQSGKDGSILLLNDVN